MIRHSSGCLSTKLRPSRISASRGRRLSRGGGVSTCWMRRIQNADHTKLTASRAIVRGAPISLIRPPAAAGPPIIAIDWTAWSLALPSPMCSGSTMSGR